MDSELKNEIYEKDIDISNINFDDMILMKKLILKKCMKLKLVVLLKNEIHV